MSMITREFNYSRKAQRVSVPLLVQYGEKLYRAADWSMTGVGVEEFPSDDLEIGARLEARLVIPISQASLSLAVVLELKNRRNGVCGFEFVDLAAAHRRVLRHYIELAMEGNLDHIEDLVADFSAPDIESPIKEALTLTEEEQTSLLQKFRSRAFLTMVAGIGLFLYILITFLYNSLFMYKALGVVFGDIVQIKAGQSGTLKKQYAKNGDIVQQNDILFDLDDSELVERLREQQRIIDKQTGLLESLEKMDQGDVSSGLLASLRRAKEEKQRELENARQLLRQGLISKKDFQFVENGYLRAQTAYMREQEARSSARSLRLEKANLIRLKRDLAVAEKKNLLARIDALRVKSPVYGSVFTTNVHEGEHIDGLEVVMTIATKTNPFVLIKIPSRESGRIQLGSEARIYSFETDQTYSGRISSIGYNSINPRMTSLQEVSLEQTIVRIDFQEPQVKLPLNSRVEVWLQRPIPFLDRLWATVKEKLESMGD